MSDEVMQDNMQDNKNPWNADLTDPMLRLRLASERLSIVRYVFLVQVEDGIASADERASLEYADAVLIGWPETDASDVITPDAASLTISTSRCGSWNSTSPSSARWNETMTSSA